MQFVRAAWGDRPGLGLGVCACTRKKKNGRGQGLARADSEAASGRVQAYQPLRGAREGRARADASLVKSMLNLETAALLLNRTMFE
jgi:hypothetical protein